MQLDKTNIVVRERGVLETMDMAVHVLVRYFAPLTVLLALVAVPLAVWNQYLIGWMMQVPEDQPFTSENFQNAQRYLWTMMLLVFFESQWAAMFATSYLGQAVFMERPKLRDIVRGTWRLFPRLMLVHGVFRGVFLAWILVWLIDQEQSFSGFDMLLIVLAGLVCWMRAARPFTDQIVLLERNPLRARPGTPLTVHRRSSMLHGPATGEEIARWLTLTVYLGLLGLALFAATVFLSGVFLFDWVVGPVMLQVNYPLVLWLLVLFATVVRFLNYLDLRIRQEGWEVELKLRAEAARLSRGLA